MNPGSEKLSLTLVKETPNQSWGFRLQGGADFTTPLSVQSVAPGGVAERCGLRAGDAVLSLNDRPSDELEHEAAKQAILMAGSQVRLVVQRGAVKVWAPKVTPLSQLLPSQGQGQANPALDGPDPYVQRTSLAADKQEYTPIGSAHNRSARPFPGFGGGASNTAPQPASNQFAAPPSTNQFAAPPSAPAANQYAPPPSSQQYAPPTSNMQGVNSAMNNSAYGSANQSEAGSDGAKPSGMRSVRAPVAKPPSEIKQQQYMTCKACGSLCVGVFIRIKGEPMHPECYKCVTCGMNLKNQGFYTIDEKLHCTNCAQRIQESRGNTTTVYR